MEKSIIVVILAFAFIITPANAELEIALDKLSPVPVEPGQDLVLSISLVNEYSEIDNVKLTT